MGLILSTLVSQYGLFNWLYIYFVQWVILFLILSVSKQGRERSVCIRVRPLIIALVLILQALQAIPIVVYILFIAQFYTICTALVLRYYALSVQGLRNLQGLMVSLRDEFFLNFAGQNWVTLLRMVYYRHGLCCVGLWLQPKQLNQAVHKVQLEVVLGLLSSHRMIKHIH